jgi:bifunctional non-homologous end joining protein LigD
VREREKPLSARPKRSPKRRVSTSKNEARAADVVITHPDRVLWSDAGITKLELARYYESIAPRLLA